MIGRGICLLTLACISSGAKPRRDETRFFDDQVAPILIKNCLGCHNHELDDGSISFENRATLLKERASAASAVIPGKPQESPLIRAIRHDGNIQMPPGKKLSPRDIAILTEWIRHGATWGTKLHPVSTPP